MLSSRESGDLLHVLRAATLKVEWRFLWAAWSLSVHPVHGVLLGGLFLGKSWQTPFKVQNAWMFSVRNPCLARTKVIGGLTRARASSTIFLEATTPWIIVRENTIWSGCCCALGGAVVFPEYFSSVTASFPFLLNWSHSCSQLCSTDPVFPLVPPFFFFFLFFWMRAFVKASSRVAANPPL